MIFVEKNVLNVNFYVALSVITHPVTLAGQSWMLHQLNPVSGTECWRVVCVALLSSEKAGAEQWPQCFLCGGKQLNNVNTGHPVTVTLTHLHSYANKYYIMRNTDLSLVSQT